MLFASYIQRGLYFIVGEWNGICDSHHFAVAAVVAVGGDMVFWDVAEHFFQSDYFFGAVAVRGGETAGKDIVSDFGLCGNDMLNAMLFVPRTNPIVYTCSYDSDDLAVVFPLLDEAVAYIRDVYC